MHLKINTSVFDSFPVLETERLVLREAQPSDADDLLKLRSDPEAERYMDRDRMGTLEEAQTNIEKVRQDFVSQKGVNWQLIDRETGNWMGYIGFWRMDPGNCRGEIGYALLPGFWRKGFMSEAMEPVLKFGFEQLHLHSVVANVNTENQASMALLERFGFVKEAYHREDYLHNGKFLDSILYGLLERDLPEL